MKVQTLSPRTAKPQRHRPDNRPRANPARGHRSIASVLLPLWGFVVATFLLAPILVAAVLAFNSGSRLNFPPVALSLRWFVTVLHAPDLMSGLQISLVIAIASTVIACVAGTAGAMAINHYQFRGRSLIYVVLLLPVALPTIVTGLGLLFAMPMLGLKAGVTAGILGHAVIGVPYVVSMVLASLTSFDRMLERASLNLGVGPMKTFGFITLRHIAPGMAAGSIAAFLSSLDNISLSLFITKNDTLPLRLMQHMQSYADPSIAAMSTLLLVLSLILLMATLPILTKKKAR